MQKRKKQKNVWALCLIMLGSVIIQPHASASQGDFTVEGFIGGGFGPQDEATHTDFDPRFGGGIGLGYRLASHLQLRTDVSLYKWDETVSGPFRPCEKILRGGCSASFKEEITNIPVFLGLRYAPWISQKATPFIDLGVSIHFLEVKEEGTLVFGLGEFGISPSVMAHLSDSERERKIGFAPGLGMRLALNERTEFGLMFRYYWVQKGIGDADNINPSFSSLAFLVAYRF